jgi:hypothetical protein
MWRWSMFFVCSSRRDNLEHAVSLLIHVLIPERLKSNRTDMRAMMSRCYLM